MCYKRILNKVNTVRLSPQIDDTDMKKKKSAAVTQPPGPCLGGVPFLIN